MPDRFSDRFSDSFPDNLFLTKAFNRVWPAFLVTGTAGGKNSITFTDLVSPKRVNFVSSCQIEQVTE